MRTSRVLSAVLILVVSTTIAAHTQDLLLSRRSALNLHVGFWRGSAASTISPGGVRAEVKAGSFIGGLQYAYWMKEDLAITVSAGLLTGKVTSTVSLLSVTQQASSVASVLLGVKYYPFQSAADDHVRLYLAGAVGPYVGSEESNTILAQESRTETAFGGRLGAGVDFFLSNHFTLGLNAGYNLMTNFEAPIGARSNYDGGDLSFGIGYIF